MTLEDNIHARAPAWRQAEADRADLRGASEKSDIVERGTADCLPVVVGDLEAAGL